MTLPTPEEILGVKTLPLVLTPAQVSKLVGVSVASVYRQMKAGEIPSIEIGAAKRVPTRWVLELLGVS